MAQLLITGGAGFIGSHAALVLLDAGYELLVFDDFSNSNPIALDSMCEPAGHAGALRLRHMQGDLQNHQGS